MVNLGSQTKSSKLVDSSSQAKIDAHDNCMECETNIHSQLQLQPTPLQLPSTPQLQPLPAHALL